jgi:hypothetical protein
MNGNFIRYGVVLLLAMGALTAPGAAAEEALRLRFSFDDTLVAEVGHVEAQGER